MSTHEEEVVNKGVKNLHLRVQELQNEINGMIESCKSGNAAIDYPSFLSHLKILLISVASLTEQLQNYAYLVIVPTVDPKAPVFNTPEALGLSTVVLLLLLLLLSHVCLCVFAEGANKLADISSTLSQTNDTQMHVQLMEEASAKGKYTLSSLESHNSAVRSALDRLTLKKESEAPNVPSLSSRAAAPRRATVTQAPELNKLRDLMDGIVPEQASPQSRGGPVPTPQSQRGSQRYSMPGKR